MASAHIAHIRSRFDNKAAQRQLVIFTSDCLIPHLHLADIMPFLRANNIKPVVFMMPDTKSPRAQIPSLRRYDYYEAGIINDVIYPALERATGRAQRITPTFNQLARAHDFTPITVDSQYHPAIAEALNAPGHIGAISIYQDTIFKADTIKAVKEKGFFWNLHPAVLPQNQGLYLIFWNMMRGRSLHGCTLHEINEGIDTGRIIDNSLGKLHDDKPVVGQYFDFVKGGSDIILKALKQQLAHGKVTYKPVSHKAETGYYSFPSEDDIARGERMGVRMIGNAEEMADIYTGIFGNDDILRHKIISAIKKYEGKNAQTVRTPEPAHAVSRVQYGRPYAIASANIR